LEPKADGFRNYRAQALAHSTEELLLDKAQLLTLTAPEMTVLAGGLRAIGVTAPGTKHGVLTKTPGALSNDVLVNLLDMGLSWSPVDGSAAVFEGRDAKAGAMSGAVWTATRADLVFGSNSQLRAIAEVYAAADAKAKFVKDFAAAFAKVMNLDRFEVA
jgi:catalase-peroxidase